MIFWALAIAAIAAMPSMPAKAEPPTLGWSDLRPKDDPFCENWHVLSQSPQICEGVPQDIEYLRCASRTNAIEGEVQITGYAHPVEIEFEGVMRFLLMPALVQCRHPPPPMANQIIFVEYPPGIDMSFDPVRVTGTITQEMSLEIGIQAPYRMIATDVVGAEHPDVID